MPNSTRLAAGVGAGSLESRFVSFSLAGKNFGLEVDEVFGIYHGTPIIPTPDLPDSMDGEISTSGLRIPVLNLRRFLDLGDYDSGASPWILAVADPGGPLGLLVDRVNEVVRLQPRELEEAADVTDLPMGQYITRKTHYNGRWLFIPDIHRLFHDALV